MKSLPDNELFSAYLDGELTAAEQAQMEQLLAESAEARQLLEELRALSSTLQSLPPQKLDEDLSERVLRTAQRRMLAGEGVRPAPAPDAPQPSLWRSISWRGMLGRRALVWSGLAVAIAVMLVIGDRNQRPKPAEKQIARATDKAPAGPARWEALPEDGERPREAKTAAKPQTKEEPREEQLAQAARAGGGKDEIARPTEDKPVEKLARAIAGADEHGEKKLADTARPDKETEAIASASRPESPPTNGRRFEADQRPAPARQHLVRESGPGLPGPETRADEKDGSGRDRTAGELARRSQPAKAGNDLLAAGTSPPATPPAFAPAPAAPEPPAMKTREPVSGPASQIAGHGGAAGSGGRPGETAAGEFARGSVAHLGKRAGKSGIAGLEKQEAAKQLGAVMVVVCDLSGEAAQTGAFDKVLAANGIAFAYQTKLFENLKRQEENKERQGGMSLAQKTLDAFTSEPAVPGASELVQVTATDAQIEAVLAQLKARPDVLSVAVNPSPGNKPGGDLDSDKIAWGEDRAHGSRRQVERPDEVGRSPKAPPLARKSETVDGSFKGFAQQIVVPGDTAERLAESSGVGARGSPAAGQGFADDGAGYAKKPSPAPAAVFPSKRAKGGPPPAAEQPPAEGPRMAQAAPAQAPAGRAEAEAAPQGQMKDNRREGKDTMKADQPSQARPVVQPAPPAPIVPRREVLFVLRVVGGRNPAADLMLAPADRASLKAKAAIESAPKAAPAAGSLSAPAGK